MPPIPPIKSASFSFCANKRPISLEAPLEDNIHTDAPLALLFLKASAWIEMKRSALALRAFLVRPLKLM